MKKTIISSMALLALIGAPGAIAQSGSKGTFINGTVVPEAPVGHRQPRASDVPDEKNQYPISKEDAFLDKKMKSICRGC